MSRRDQAALVGVLAAVWAAIGAGQLFAVVAFPVRGGGLLLAQAVVHLVGAVLAWRWSADLDSGRVW